jgi:tetratricopeptide (TPR) repeat protein
MNVHGRRVWRTLAIFLIFLAVGCNRDEKTLLDDLLTVEEGSYRDIKVSDKTVEELQEAIGLLKGEVERTIEAGVRLVIYYKLAGQKFMEQELYGLAADFYSKVLEIHPANRLVAYRLGVCNAQVARAEPDAEIRKADFERALAYHLYALELDPTFADALYAVSVLYIFELDAIENAEVYLERLIAVDSNHIGGMFLLARVYAHYGRIEDAVSLYDEIIRESESTTETEQAKQNRAVLSGVQNGN